MKRSVYFASKRLYWIAGIVPQKNRTPHIVDGRPVVVIHNPKAAGTTLKALLGAKGTTHTMPRHAYRRSVWRSVFSVVAVRHPFDRFVSGYSFHCRAGRRGALYREVGPELHDYDAFEYFELIRQFPEKLGRQVNWAHYPDPEKPTADLILKTEESDTWVETLAAHGIEANGEVSRRLNPSRKAGESLRDTLRLSQEELERLEGLVFEAYAPDYPAFGYDRLPPSW